MKIIERIKGITLNPKNEWNLINQENTPSTVLLTTYLIPLALIPAIAGLIGFGLIGYREDFIGHISGFPWGIKWAVILFSSMLLGSYLSAFIIDLLSTNFGGEKNFDKAFSLVVYSYTPMMVAGVLYILPSLKVLPMLAGFYGLYLLSLGMRPLMKPKEDKATSYIVISFIVNIIVFAIVYKILFNLFIGKSIVNPAAF